MPPSVSVIVPTLGRTQDVRDLLCSLVPSTLRPLEIVLVDQNCSDLLDDIVAHFSTGDDALPIRHLKVGLRGLSRAKNYGARMAQGEVLCFPDDDCQLQPETLARGIEFLEDTQGDAIFGRSLSPDGRDAVAPFESAIGRLTRAHHEGRFLDHTIFIKRAVFARAPYDEALGVGEFHGAEEGHDQVLRLLEAGARLYYSPDVIFYHPIKVNTHQSKAEIRRVFSYRCGLARLCLKHRLYAKLFGRLTKVVLALPVLWLLRRGSARYYAAELLGLLSGIAVP